MSDGQSCSCQLAQLGEDAGTRESDGVVLGWRIFRYSVDLFRLVAMCQTSVASWAYFFAAGRDARRVDMSDWRWAAVTVQ